MVLRAQLLHIIHITVHDHPRSCILTPLTAISLAHTRFSLVALIRGSALNLRGSEYARKRTIKQQLRVYQVDSALQARSESLSPDYWIDKEA